MSEYQRMATQLQHQFEAVAKTDFNELPNFQLMLRILENLEDDGYLHAIAAQIAGRMKINVSQAAYSEASLEIGFCADALCDCLKKMAAQLAEHTSIEKVRILMLEASTQMSLEFT